MQLRPPFCSYFFGSTMSYRECMTAKQRSLSSHVYARNWMESSNWMESELAITLGVHNYVTAADRTEERRTNDRSSHPAGEGVLQAHSDSTGHFADASRRGRSRPGSIGTAALLARQQLPHVCTRSARRPCSLKQRRDNHLTVKPRPPR